ncbi:sortase [Patescibacteria group bacterium]
MEADKTSSIKPKNWRRWLGISLMTIGAAIIIYPLWPVIRYEILRPEPSFPYATKLSANPELFHLPEINTKSEFIPQDNRLVVPKIGVDIPITEGADENALYRGAWRIPYTSNPIDGGNTVLSAHRFQYTAGPMTFFLLPKLEPDDTFIVYWQGQEYDYQVTDKKVVHRSEVSVLNNTESPQVTLFTCTPVYQRNSEWRLVIIGEPI